MQYQSSLTFKWHRSRFEKGIHGLGVHCEVHIYDPTSSAPREAAQLGWLVGKQIVAMGKLKVALVRSPRDHINTSILRIPLVLDLRTRM